MNSPLTPQAIEIICEAGINSNFPFAQFGEAGFPERIICSVNGILSLLATQISEDASETGCDEVDAIAGAQALLVLLRLSEECRGRKQ